MARGGRSFGGFGGGGRSYRNGDKRYKYTGGGPRRSGCVVQLRDDEAFLSSTTYTQYRCEFYMDSLVQTIGPQNNKLNLLHALDFNENLVNCPEIPDLRELTENGENDTPARKKGYCERLQYNMEHVLSQQNQELTASQNAFFTWFLDKYKCPDAA